VVDKVALKVARLLEWVAHHKVCLLKRWVARLKVVKCLLLECRLVDLKVCRYD
jgi:hypothetical protein